MTDTKKPLLSKFVDISKLYGAIMAISTCAIFLYNIQVNQKLIMETQKEQGEKIALIDSILHVIVAEIDIQKKTIIGAGNELFDESNKSFKLIFNNMTESQKTLYIILKLIEEWKASQYNNSMILPDTDTIRKKSSIRVEPLNQIK